MSDRTGPPRILFTTITWGNPNPPVHTVKASTGKEIQSRPWPISVHVEKGRRYYWCTCSASRKQPFCDGRHEGTHHRPQVYVAPETGTVTFCACKTTKNPPLCDGSHLQVLKKMYGKKAALLVTSGVLAGGYGFRFFRAQRQAAIEAAKTE